MASDEFRDEFDKRNNELNKKIEWLRKVAQEANITAREKRTKNVRKLDLARKLRHGPKR